MRSIAALLLLLAGMALNGEDRRTPLPATSPSTSPSTMPATAPSTFTWVDVIIDPKGKPLAAWQVEFAAETGRVALVGVEQGEHPAYAHRPPYYDPAALAGNRVILGDFSLDNELPKAATRVARLMVEIRGAQEPTFVAKLVAAATPDARRIAAQVTLVPAKP